MQSNQKIKMLLAYKNISEAELARLLKTTPSAFNQRMKNNKFTIEDLTKIAHALNVKFEYQFIDNEVKI